MGEFENGAQLSLDFKTKQAITKVVESFEFLSVQSPTYQPYWFWDVFAHTLIQTCSTCVLWNGQALGHYG
jgi:hypothetical protein